MILRRWFWAAFLLAGCLGAPRRPAVSNPVPAPTPLAAESTETVPPPAPSLHGSVTILCAGDIMPAHRLEPFLRREGLRYPWKHLIPLFSGVDAYFFNFEAPIGKSAVPFPKKYTFLVAPAHTETLLVPKARPVAGLANNHILDQGTEALMETFQALDQRGIARTGAGRNLAEARTPARIDINGIRLAFLAYSLTFPEEFYAGPSTPGTAFGKEKHVRADVSAAKKTADRVIVSFHWGSEYETGLRPYQAPMARAAVEAGADLVVGHHTHKPQGSELIKGVPVVYGLGNFIFGTGSQNGKGAVLRVRFDEKGTHMELIPLNVNPFKTNYQNRPFRGKELKTAMEELRGLSPSLPWREETDRLVWP